MRRARPVSAPQIHRVGQRAERDQFRREGAAFRGRRRRSDKSVGPLRLWRAMNGNLMTMLSTLRRMAAGSLAALTFAAVAAAQTAFAPAVVVNDDVITYYDVEQR